MKTHKTTKSWREDRYLIGKTHKFACINVNFEQTVKNFLFPPAQNLEMALQRNYNDHQYGRQKNKP